MVTRRSDDRVIMTAEDDAALELPTQAVLELTGGGHQPCVFHAS